MQENALRPVGTEGDKHRGTTSGSSQPSRAKTSGRANTRQRCNGRPRSTPTQVFDPSGAGSTVYSAAAPLLFSPARGSLCRNDSTYSSASSLYAGHILSEIAKNVKPSARGELEITAVNNEYLNRKQLKVQLFDRGIAWLDTGTVANMTKASLYVESVQSNQGQYISCIEEIAWRRGFITKEQLKQIGEEMSMTEYGKYILSLTEEK